MKHKHAELIHAWADGAEIQWQDDEGNWNDGEPSWQSFRKYRIKPSFFQNTTNEEKKPVVRWLWAYKNIEGTWTTSSYLYTEEDAEGWEFKFKLEWSRTEFPE